MKVGMNSEMEKITLITTDVFLDLLKKLSRLQMVVS